jgi:hypothetical protein
MEIGIGAGRNAGSSSTSSPRASSSATSMVGISATPRPCEAAAAKMEKSS